MSLKMSPKKGTKPQRVRIAANGYRLCDPLPKGEVLIDTQKQEWILGTPIGCGGFGDIYSCRRKGERNDDYVIKLDHITGPLFQEMNFYMRAAKEEQIKTFMAKHKLKFLGIPRFIANGIHDKSSAVSNKRNKDSNQTTLKKDGPTIQYRFLVIHRFGDQLDDWVKDKRVTTALATDIAAKLIDVLQYIHSLGYIHADIKGSNILKSMSKSKTNEWYLVDYGLAERYCDQNGVHRQNKPDRKRANNGTVEYRSRDAHVGLLSRRSDIECLSYNLIQWLYGTLPWMSCLKDANKVARLKEDFFTNLDQSLRKCFKKSVPNGLKEFLRFVNKIDFNEEPDYSRLKDILMKKISKQTSSDGNTDEDEETDIEDNDEEEEEVFRKASNSSSESTVDAIRMNSPLKENPWNKSKSKPLRDNKRLNNKRKDYYIELSDSEEDSSLSTLDPSPPKRTRAAVVSPKKTREVVNSPKRTRTAIVSPKKTRAVVSPKNATNGRTPANDLLSPSRRSPRKPLPRFSTPLLFANEASDESKDSTQEDEVFDVPALELDSSGDSSRPVRRSEGKPAICNETPAMREMREKIEQKKRLEKESKKKRKQTKK